MSFVCARGASIRRWQRLFAFCLGLMWPFVLFGPVWADSVAIDFEDPPYITGTIDGQDGWSSSGSAGAGAPGYDHAVAANSYGYPTFDGQSLRMSNAVVSGSFGDHTFSKSLNDEAGEASAQSGGFSGGVRQPYFEAQWDFASTVPTSEQPGLTVVASPDRGDGARMSWVQMADTPTGLAVNFNDYQHSLGAFVQTTIAIDVQKKIREKGGNEFGQKS